MRFSSRLFLSFFLILTISVSMCGSLLIFISFNTARDRETSSAVNSFRLVYYSLTASSQWNNFSLDGAVDLLENAETSEGSVFMIRQDENVIYRKSSRSGAYDGGNDALVNAPKSEVLYTNRFSGEDGRHYIQVTAMLPYQLSSFSLDGIFNAEGTYETLRMQQKIYFAIYAFTLLISLSVLLLLKNWLTAPLKKLSRTSSRIAQGNTEIRADDSGNDEFALLARDFNTMADALTADMMRQRDFTAAFAHEIKTPMTSIIGFADILRSRNLSEEQRIKAAGVIFSEAGRLERLSQRLLDIFINEKDDIPLKKTDIKNLVEMVCEEEAPVFAKQGINFSWSCEHCVALAEPDLLRSLIINLLDNARKAFAGNGGGGQGGGGQGGGGQGDSHIVQTYLDDVTVTLSTATLSAATLSAATLSTDVSSNGFMITVSDNGIGIPKEDLERITEAFYMADKSRSRAMGGFGLGLALCERIASIHNGKLSFESTLGEGTTVTFLASPKEGQERRAEA